MHDSVRDELINFWASSIDGGSATFWLEDTYGDNGPISYQYFLANEKAIYELFDEYFFQCTDCGWYMPTDCLNNETGNIELICEDCGGSD